MGEDVRTVERPTVGAEGETAPTVGGVVSWLVFGWVTATIGWMALPQAGRLYDFRAFYAAGDMVRHQPGRLYDLAAQAAVQNAVVCPMWRGVPFYHPSYEALLYVPLTWMHYHTAYMVYVVWNLLLLGAAYMLAPRTVDAAVAKAPRAALFFLCFPAFMCVVEGQNSVLFFVLMCVVWQSLDAGEDAMAGALLALGLFKLPVALAVAFFVALRRGWRFVAGFGVVGAVVALLCVAVTGVRGMADWLRLVGAASVAMNEGRQAERMVAVYPKAMPSLNGLVYVCGGRLLSAHASVAVTAGLAVVVFAASVYLAMRARRMATVFCVGILAALLLSPHLFLYDYTLMLFPVLLLRGRVQPWAAALNYVLPIVLFAGWALDWFSLMAVVPVMFLWVCAEEVSGLWRKDEEARTAKELPAGLGS